MGAILIDWAGLFVRWAHVMVGIAWIGTSFHFIWLDASLRREAQPPGRRRRQPGWSMAAASITPRSIWSRRQTCRRSCTGSSTRPISPGSPASCCSSSVYYLNAEAFLIDPEVLDAVAGCGHRHQHRRPGRRLDRL